MKSAGSRSSIQLGIAVEDLTAVSLNCCCSRFVQEITNHSGSDRYPFVRCTSLVCGLKRRLAGEKWRFFFESLDVTYKR